MGLLDSLFSQDTGNGVGGLLSYLQSPLYQSPLLKKDEIQQAQYDPMGNYTGITPQAPNPFGPIPQANLPPPSQFQAPSVFNSGAPTLAGLPNAPPPPPPSPTPSAVPSPPQTSQDTGPINTMNVGGYQMPQFGTMADYTPSTTIPANAQPTQGQLPSASQQPSQQAPQQLPPALGGGSYIDRVHNGGSLIGSLFGGNSQQQNLKAQYDSLVPVLGPQKALLAVMNPEAGKTLLSEALTNKTDYGVVGEDALGNKQYGWIDKLNQTINGKPMGAESGSEGSNGAPSGNFSFLAPGVKQVDSSLQGQDYLKQYSPEVQTAVKDYIEGRSMPTGNPRKGFTQAVKMIAQKYGADIGTPADDAAFAERRKMLNDIGASSNSSMGGILSNGKSAFEHLKTYSDKLTDVGNVNVGGPGGGIAANLYNGVTNYAGSSAQRGKVSAATEAGLKYGQESTKFYSGSGGGAEERLAALRANDANSKSGAEQAGFLQAEKELMVGRLKEKESQIRDVLGQDYLDKHPVFTPELQKTIDKVDSNIARLKGDQPASSAKPATVIQNGHTYTLQADGSYK